jgi:hypothetical protein
MSQKRRAALKPESDFPEFREGVIQNLSFRRLSGSWVPFLISSDSGRDGEVESPLASYIDGYRSINDISNESGMRQTEVIPEINRLWALGLIRFGSTLGMADIALSCSKMDRLMQSGSPLRTELGRKDPKALAMLPSLSALLDGRRTVGAIIESLSVAHSESEVLQALDNLLETGAITVLTPEKRRILLVKEAFELAMRVCEVVYSPEDALGYLADTLEKIQTPEVTGVIRIAGTTWSVDYDSRLHEGLDPKMLMDLYAEWMKLLAQFTSALDKAKLNKYAEALTNAFESYLLARYSREDLDGFEEYSFWLEMNCVGTGGLK